jgi:hypothetical protein
LGHTEAATLLQETLDEEKAADEKLSALAEDGINQDAADAAQPDDDEGPAAEEDEAVGVGKGAKKAPASKGRAGARQ